MPRVLDPVQTENIMKLVRAHFKVEYPHKGHYQMPGFVPGYGRWTTDASGRKWSDDEVAREVGCRQSSVSYIRTKQFGCVQINGTTAPQPEPAPKSSKKQFVYPGAGSEIKYTDDRMALEMLSEVLTRLVESNERVERQLAEFTGAVQTVIDMAKTMDMATKPTGDARLDTL